MKQNINHEPKTASEWLEYWEKMHDDEFKTMFPEATLVKKNKE